MSDTSLTGGACANTQTSIDQVIDQIQQDLRNCREAKDKIGEGRAYGRLGVVHQSRCEYQKARECQEKSLEIAKEAGDRVGEANAYGNLGILFHIHGDLRQAVEYHKLDLQIAKEVGDRAAEGSACYNLGNACRSLGDLKQAFEYDKQSMKIAKELGDRAAEGRACINLGNAYRSMGNYKKALEYHKQSLDIATERGDKAGEGYAYGNLGNVYRNLGNHTKAVMYLEKRLSIAKKLKDKIAEGRAFANLGIAYQNLGDFKKAIECQEKRLEIVIELKDKAGEGQTYGSLANTFRKMGDFTKAMEYQLRSMDLCEDSGAKVEVARTNSNLGNVYHSVGNYKQALECYTRSLKIDRKVGNRAGEGQACHNIGNVYLSMGDYKRAIEYYEESLDIVKEIGNRSAEGCVYSSLGNAFRFIGYYSKALEYYFKDLAFAQKVGDRAAEARICGNLGNTYNNLSDYKNAICYCQKSLGIFRDIGDKAGEGNCYCALGLAHQSLLEFEKAVEHYQLSLDIAKQVGHKAGEMNAYSGLGIALGSLGDLEKASECHKLSLDIATSIGDMAVQARAQYLLGGTLEPQDLLVDALRCYESSVELYNQVRNQLQSNDDWKINLRHDLQRVYTALWCLLLKQDKKTEAWFAAEQGRAQALEDLMTSRYSPTAEELTHWKTSFIDIQKYIQSPIVFLALSGEEINIWVLKGDGEVHFRKSRMSTANFDEGGVRNLESLIGITNKKMHAREMSEDRSLQFLDPGAKVTESKNDEGSNNSYQRMRDGDEGEKIQAFGTLLKIFYDLTVGPVANLLHGEELIIVPDGPLFLVPFAAFLDPNSRYLSDSFRIRCLPSVTSLKLISDCSSDFHSKSGSLIVGDPWVEEIVVKRERRMVKALEQLPCAQKEASMIGNILNISPLIGKEATKEEVLKRLNSVALIHIAAHGKLETGEIALAPNPDRASDIPKEEDFLLTMNDVLTTGLRAQLVVLSCCHSGRGDIKAEGVVGIARAFLGAGARSVLVSLWAISDEATLEFMKGFYELLFHGKSASESLNLAMKSLRESEKFNAVNYWAPFVLIGDDVTLKFKETD